VIGQYKGRAPLDFVRTECPAIFFLLHGEMAQNQHWMVIWILKGRSEGFGGRGNVRQAVDVFDERGFFLLLSLCPRFKFTNQNSGNEMV
jgi:hypothetical protein